MLIISQNLSIPEEELEFHAIRAQGAGGQNVNKVSSAIHLRFDIRNSSLPEACKEKLLSLNDRRISKDGVIIIKAQQYRTQDKNRADALERLRHIIQRALIRRKKRKPTRPSRKAAQRRLDAKTRQGRLKRLRRRVVGENE
jgi:ribosome-associated protein